MHGHQIRSSVVVSFLPLAAIVLAVVALVWIVFSHQDVPFDPRLRVQRVLPLHVAPGQELPVQLKLSTEASFKGIILKEEFPPGWRFVSSEPQAASVDTATGVARWIFRNPQTPLHVFYRIGVPPDVQFDSQVVIRGELLANPDGQQFVLPVAADQLTSIRPFHWADTNADHMIDDMEILIFSEMTEDTSELDEEWYLVEQIWHSGSYRWDHVDNRFVPTRIEENAAPAPADDN